MELTAIYSLRGCLIEHLLEAWHGGSSGEQKRPGIELSWGEDSQQGKGGLRKSVHIPQRWELWQLCKGGRAGCNARVGPPCWGAPHGWPRPEGWEEAVMVGRRAMWQRPALHPPAASFTPLRASGATSAPLSLFTGRGGGGASPEGGRSQSSPADGDVG